MLENDSDYPKHQLSENKLLCRNTGCFKKNTPAFEKKRLVFYTVHPYILNIYILTDYIKSTIILFPFSDDWQRGMKEKQHNWKEKEGAARILQRNIYPTWQYHHNLLYFKLLRVNKILSNTMKSILLLNAKNIP